MKGRRWLRKMIFSILTILIYSFYSPGYTKAKKNDYQGNKNNTAFAYVEPVINTFNVFTQSNALLCAIPSVSIHNAPNSSSNVIGNITFGEEILNLGNSSFDNGTTFIQIQTTRNQIGWVKENALIKDGGLVVFLENARIYPNPDFDTPVYQSSFERSDLAILVDFQDEWMRLVGDEPGKEGWVHGLNKVSIEPADLSIGRLILAAEKESNPQVKFAALQSIKTVPGYVNSPLAMSVDQKLLNAQADPSSVARVSNNPKTNVITTSRAVNAPLPVGSQYFIEDVLDPATGRTFKRVTEIGGYQPVSGPANPKSIYFAYHKTLPIGTEILLENPRGGYTKLTVINKLKKENINILGLGEGVLKETFGSEFRNVKKVKILYPL